MTVRATEPDRTRAVFFLVGLLASILRATRSTPNEGATARITDG